MFRRLFGNDPSASKAPAAQAGDAAAAPAGSAAETATVRQIVGRLESLPPERARYIACAAYVVTRAANADMLISAAETAFLEQALQKYADLDESQAVLVVEMAKLQAITVGGTEDYLVTREFRKVSTPEQRLNVLRACLVVAAADDSITAEESAVVNQIASELDIDQAQLSALRGEFTEKFAAIQAAHRAAAEHRLPED
jgi:uncharacterized tellurite resistance protein B-like protein